MGILLTADAAAQGSTLTSTLFMVGWLVIIVAFFYFVMIRPQKKEQKQKQEMLGSLEIGDSVLTTSGFYGVVIDINDDTVIVEFGNNKNCRIPMAKTAINQVEKASDQ
ncbi:MAG: preprotein translocase subunit YajC [Lachnospiraceae bacterium]|jgi:preprotein translocase subunit YajC|nr:preprotein translocase subunit YajC [Lachnospiraceae bacterium]